MDTCFSGKSAVCRLHPKSIEILLYVYVSIMFTHTTLKVIAYKFFQLSFVFVIQTNFSVIIVNA